MSLVFSLYRYIHNFYRKSENIGKSRAKEAAFHFQLVSAGNFLWFALNSAGMLRLLLRKLPWALFLKCLADLSEGGWEVGTRGMAISMLYFRIVLPPILSRHGLQLRHVS
jgi:hypothetical protein